MRRSGWRSAWPVPATYVLLAGKGHEDYQIIGTVKHHFDDREEAAAAFAEKVDLMFTINEIALATGGRIIGLAAGEVTAVSTDSRSVAPGELFVPLRGERFDGHTFIQDVAEKGITVVMAEEQWLKGHSIPDSLTCIAVKNSLRGAG